MADHCIYCGSKDNWNEEHCLPAGLGRFRGYHNLTQTLCSRCNNHLSVIEEQFLRASPEAFFRHILSIKGRKYHNKVNPFYRGSAGAPPLVIKHPMPETGVEVFWEALPGSNELREVRQIVMKREDGEYLPIILHPEIDTIEKFRVHLNGYDLENAEPHYLIGASSDEWSLFKEWLNELWPKKRLDELGQWNRGGRKLVAVKVTVTDKYFRAIAKIAFHYFLANFGNFTGNEPEFSPIRRFIYEGIGVERNFVQETRRQFIFDFDRGYETEVWGHILSVEKLEYNIIARLQFFAGPGYQPWVYQVNIGRNPSKLYYPENYGHFYNYFPDGPIEGYDGELSELNSVSRILIPNR